MTIRSPSAAGVFYPADAHELTDTVDRMLAEAGSPVGDEVVRAIVVPHAAYMFSGAVAASAYATMRPDTVERVVIVGPAHFVPIDGVAAPEATAFGTPLGSVPVDASMLAGVAVRVARDDAPHAPEHSVEVQLPFVLRRFGRVPVLPLVCGQAADEDVAEILRRLWGDGTVVVCSTDLSHYLPDDVARTLDRRTASSICALDPDAIADTDACGAAALRGLLTMADGKGSAVRLLDLRTSADAGADGDRVVGYGAFAFI